MKKKKKQHNCKLCLQFTIVITIIKIIIPSQIPLTLQPKISILIISIMMRISIQVIYKKILNFVTTKTECTGEGLCSC